MILFRPDDVLDNGNFLGLFRRGVGKGAKRVAVTTAKRVAVTTEGACKI